MLKFPTQCFSKKTFQVLIENKIIEAPIVAIQFERKNKKMYKCEYKNFLLEFTEDHPFMYNNKFYKFKDLITIHSDSFKSIKEISFDDPEYTTIYNIIKHPKQFDENNMFLLDENLKIVGGYMDDLGWEKQKQKMKKIQEIDFENADINDPNIQNILKYTSLENFIENGDQYDMIDFFF